MTSHEVHGRRPLRPRALAVALRWDAMPLPSHARTNDYDETKDQPGVCFRPAKGAPRARARTWRAAVGRRAHCALPRAQTRARGQSAVQCSDCYRDYATDYGDVRGRRKAPGGGARKGCCPGLWAIHATIGKGIDAKRGSANSTKDHDGSPRGEQDGDEHGVAADLRAAMTRNGIVQGDPDCGPDLAVCGHKYKRIGGS